MKYSQKFSVLMLFVLMLASEMLFAAESAAASAGDATADDVTSAVDKADGSEPVVVSPSDSTEAGKAKHAFMQANVCEGMEKGDYLGPEVCADCHLDKMDTMAACPHGQSADQRSPFGHEGCETCHGPGMLHFETEGNCIISMTGRYGETVYQRNEICLGCHNSGDRMHWLSSVHEAENLACVSCHSIHKPNDVIERAAQAEV